MIFISAKLQISANFGVIGAIAQKIKKKILKNSRISFFFFANPTYTYPLTRAVGLQKNSDRFAKKIASVLRNFRACVDACAEIAPILRQYCVAVVI